MPPMRVSYAARKGFFFVLGGGGGGGGGGRRKHPRDMEEQEEQEEQDGASQLLQPEAQPATSAWASGPAARSGRGPQQQRGGGQPRVPWGFTVLQRSGHTVQVVTGELNVLNARLRDASNDCMVLTEQVSGCGGTGKWLQRGRGCPQLISTTAAARPASPAASAQVLDGVAQQVVSAYMTLLHCLVDNLALLDMLAAFALVASGCGGAAASGPYVRPALTQASCACGKGGGAGAGLRAARRACHCSAGCHARRRKLPLAAAPHRRAPWCWWRRGTRCWKCWTPAPSSPTTPTWPCTPTSTSSQVAGQGGVGWGGVTAALPSSSRAHLHTAAPDPATSPPAPGPNMAGKSTYLRQVALVVVMAQAGSFVPAAFASLPPRDRLLSRLGTGDSLETCSSSFMVEMQVWGGL